MASTKAKGRSPSYPAIDLETALGRAQALYEHERRNAAAVDTILQHWGYRPKSGLGLVTLAALKKFGLLVDQGQGAARKARLSDLALKILLAPPESAERQGAIEKAAVTPPIHQELFDRFGLEPPSDANLKYFLTFERKFTDRGAEEFIEEYRSTMTFANLTESANLSANGGDSEIVEVASPRPVGGGGARSMVSTPTGRPAPAFGHEASRQKFRVFVFPLPGGGAVQLEASRPLTDEEWTTFTTMVNMSKTSFVDPVDLFAPGDPDED